MGETALDLLRLIREGIRRGKMPDQSFVRRSDDGVEVVVESLSTRIDRVLAKAPAVLTGTD